jgi:uncharacterized protein
MDVGAATIFLTLAGSQAHGTARVGSDVDIRGVCLLPLQERLSLFRLYDQFEGALPESLLRLVMPAISAHATAGRAFDVKNETVIFETAKFLRLCTDANPNALEILFADPRDWLLDTPPWRLIYERRHIFLTKRVQHTFYGYAQAQLRRIRTHRSWLLHPPQRRPDRADFGLSDTSTLLTHDDRNRFEQRIAEVLRTYEIDDIEMPSATRIAVHERVQNLREDLLMLLVSQSAAVGNTNAAPDSRRQVEDSARAVAAHALRIPADVFAALTSERRYRDAVRHWDSYQTWLRERNPARAELERHHGYDTKHAMHLVRLMRMGIEALTDGDLHVRRRDAADLVAIRDGALSFDELEKQTDALQEDMQRAATATTLPSDVDRESVDRMFRDLAGAG